jgi:hypothetical protein
MNMEPDLNATVSTLSNNTSKSALDIDTLSRMWGTIPVRESAFIPDDTVIFINKGKVEHVIKLVNLGNEAIECVRELSKYKKLFWHFYWKIK